MVDMRDDGKVADMGCVGHCGRVWHPRQGWSRTRAAGISKLSALQEFPPVKAFSDLTEQEILALAITSEDEDARTYASFAHDLMEKFPASAAVFVEMAEEEHE